MSPCVDFSMIPRYVPLNLEDPSVKSVYLPMLSYFWSSLISNSTSGCRSSLKPTTNFASACDFIVDLGSYLISYVLNFTDHFAILPDISSFHITFLMG